MEPSKHQHSLNEYGGMRNLSIVSKPVFSQGCNNINTNMLSSGPFQSGFGPKVKSGLYLVCETSSFFFWINNKCMLWDCKSGLSVVFSSKQFFCFTFFFSLLN